MQDIQTYKIMIEESTAEGDFMAYIPALRTGARGDSKAEALLNAKDLLEAAIELSLNRGTALPKDTAILETIELNVFPAVLK